MISGYFDTNKVKNLDDLKKQFYILSKELHPDTSGRESKDEFQSLLNEYHELTNSFLTSGNFTKEQIEREVEVDEAYLKVIKELISIPDITVEVIGSWIWVSGNTFPIRETLKKLTFHFAPVKKMWYINTTGIKTKKGKELNIDQIRSKYGTTVFDFKGPKKITGLSKISGPKQSRIKKAFQKLIKAMHKKNK